MKNAPTKNKTITGLLSLAIGMTLLFSACKKDNNTNNNTAAVPDDEVETAVTNAVSPMSGGMVLQTEATTQMAGNIAFPCGGSSDTTIAGGSGSGASITYSYNLQFTRTLECTNNIPAELLVDFQGNCSYDGPHLSSVDTGTAELTITGLEGSSSAYVLNGNYVRKGSAQTTYWTQHSFTTTLTITATNINVDKSTMKITSGTGAVQFTAVTSTGGTVNRGGTITFLGNQQATLLLDDGATVNISWQ